MDPPSGARHDHETAWVIAGPVSGIATVEATAWAVLWGTDVMPYGQAAGAADMDDDGVDEILDWARTEDHQEVYVVDTPVFSDVSLVDAALAVLVPQSLSPDPCFSYGYDWGHFAEGGLAGGDLDGDGIPDVAVGDANWSPDEHSGCPRGIVYVAHGPLSGTIDLIPDATVLKGDDHDDIHTGAVLTGPGDITGDGTADLLVTAPGEHVVWVVPGPAETSGDIADLAFALEGFAYDLAVTGVGDMNGDAANDILVGDGGVDYGEGAAWLFLGPISTALTTDDAVRRLEGDGSLMAAGASVASAGDVDSDGIPDLLVGAPNAWYGEIRTGAACLVLGASLGL